jgi:hypothetical protein
MNIPKIGPMATIIDPEVKMIALHETELRLP